MSTAFFTIEPLLANIDAGHLILTPNQRLARHILDAFGQHCLEQEKSVWHQPPVFSLESWLEERWAELMEADYLTLTSQARSVINKHDENLLWQASIARDNTLASDADIPALATLAMRTWQQMQAANLPPHEIQDSHHPGSEAFLRWLTHFEEQLKQRNLLTWGQALGLILQAQKDACLPPCDTICLVGFQTLPALHHDIIHAATPKLIQYSNAIENTVTDDLHLQPCRNEKNEIARAAHWAKAQIDAHPDQRIGVVFGKLANTHHLVSRIFHDTFLPENCLPAAERCIPPYNLSAGTPLSNTPLIESAFLLLRVQHAALPLEDWCRILRDPFWGPCSQSSGQAQPSSQAQASNQVQSGDQDNSHALIHNAQLIARNQCEINLRRSNKLSHRPVDFRTHLAQAESNLGLDTPSASLSTLWGTVNTHIKQGEKTADFHYWATAFTQKLHILGWPGPRTLDSIEYQQHQHWLTLIQQFAALDTQKHYSVNAALAQLARIAKDTPFQAQTPNSNLQILGLLEASGLHFDQLWIAGMDDQQWPQSTQLNPLLPVDIQQQYQLPRSSAKQELRLAKKMLADFQHCSKKIIFSYATQDGDSARDASHLLPTTQLLDLPSVSQQHPLIRSLPPTLLENLETTTGPALVINDKPVRGGAAILQAQAGCPFNAFARWRLGAEPLAEPSSGLSPLERGNIVHKCLEIFWTQISSLEKLRALDDATLDTTLAELIKNVLLPLHSERSDLFGPRFAAIETRRLTALLQQWLHIEKGRKNFTVLAPEKQLSMTVAGLPLSLRIDRIDKLDDGRVVLIDYKTGHAEIKHWLSKRLDEPQLPLYATALPDAIAGLCFAQISTLKSVTAKGLSDTPEILRGLQALEKNGLSDWDHALRTWKKQLEILAQEFIKGHADIIFYSDAAQRYQTHLHPLNRWPEIVQRTTP